MLQRAARKQTGSNVLFTLVAAYEAEHHAIDLPDPLAMLEHVMENRGLTHEQLEPYIGSARLVDAVLNRQHPLTLAMIRRFTSWIREFPPTY